MKKHTFCGTIAAPFVAMHSDGRINLDAIEKQIASLKTNGVPGAFVCGTTGESLSLTVAERCQVSERWQALAGKDFRVIVHVGHVCLADCQTLAAHAQQIGVSAIGCMAPSFFRPSTVEALVQYCAAVAAVAPRLPFYFYHLPSFTFVDFPMATFLKVASDQIPTLAGIKFTHENLMDFGRCVHFDNERFDMLYGRDETLLAGLALGATGAVGSTYNYAAPLYRSLIAAFQAGDLPAAQRFQQQSMEMIEIMIRFGGIPASKAIMRIMGLDCGPVRQPQRNLSARQVDELKTELDKIGFFSYCSKV